MRLAIVVAGLTLFIAAPEKAHAQGSAVVATDSVNARVRAKSKKKVAVSATKSTIAPEAVAAAIAFVRTAPDSSKVNANRHAAPPVPKRSAPTKPPKKPS